MPPTKRDRRLPFEAHDARLFDLWRRGTVEAFVLAEVTAPPDSAEAGSQAARLVRLNQMMNAARAAAKRADAPGWEDLYRATIRLHRDSEGRLGRLTVEPRTAELDSLLGGAALAPIPAPTRNDAASLAPSDDILSDIFGPAPGEQ